MTKKMLWRRLWCVGLLFVAMIVVGVLIQVRSGPTAFGVFKDLMPVAISIAAVYLAHVFQERSMFIQALRSLWSDLIEAKNELLAYAHLPAPTPEDYTKAYRTIATAIDEMRGGYRNVGEDEEHVGYFPYEPLHDMRKALKQLDYKNISDEKRKQVGEAIEQAWLALRYNFLSEFETPEPTHPIWARGTRRVQKQGIAPKRRGVMGIA
jgi:hypothetical protein